MALDILSFTVAKCVTRLGFVDFSLFCKSVIVASGRKELLDFNLKNWKHKVVFSGAILNHKIPKKLSRVLEKSSCANLAVLGGSHSAFSALEKLFEICKNLLKCDTPDVAIVVNLLALRGN